jgi:hypothetical protein
MGGDVAQRVLIGCLWKCRLFAKTLRLSKQGVEGHCNYACFSLSHFLSFTVSIEGFWRDIGSHNPQAVAFTPCCN